MCWKKPPGRRTTVFNRELTAVRSVGDHEVLLTQQGATADDVTRRHGL